MKTATQLTFRDTAVCPKCGREFYVWRRVSSAGKKLKTTCHWSGCWHKFTVTAGKPKESPK